MLSFFSKKKPESPLEEPIQGPADPTQGSENGGGDDFIFVERKPTNNDPANLPAQQNMGIYPPMPPMYGISRYPGQPGYPPSSTSMGGRENVIPVPYVQGIPFELAPQLSSKCDFEVTQLEVDSILALLTRQMSMDESEEYTFALERSIQNECY